MLSSDIDAFICAALRGEAPAWPCSHEPQDVSQVLQRARRHGVQALLYRQSRHLPWPAAALEGLRADALASAAWEEAHRHALVLALHALADWSITPLLFKGSALAYGTYAEPSLRPRLDTDLLIAPSQRKAAAAALVATGFEQQGSVEGEFVSYEAGFSYRVGGSVQTLDLHWRIHYSQLQAACVPYELLLRDARPLPHLSANALAVSPVHAVLVCCLHRTNDLRIPQHTAEGSMFGFDRLIAWHDIHLLIEQMSASELQVLADTATRHQLAAICRETLVVATQHFGTRMEVPLDEVFPDSPPDLVARYQRASAWRRRWLDLRAVPGTRARLAYMREHIAPPADYMRTRYPGAAAPLAWLRARRLMAGLSHSRQRA